MEYWDVAGTYVVVVFLIRRKQDLNGEGEGGEEQARKLRDFFMALALCHTVIPERFEDTDEVIYAASLALTCRIWTQEVLLSEEVTVSV